MAHAKDLIGAASLSLALFGCAATQPAAPTVDEDARLKVAGLEDRAAQAELRIEALAQRVAELEAAKPVSAPQPRRENWLAWESEKYHGTSGVLGVRPRPDKPIGSFSEQGQCERAAQAYAERHPQHVEGTVSWLEPIRPGDYWIKTVTCLPQGVDPRAS